MAIRATCANCGKSVKGGDDWAGKSGKCPGCGQEIQFNSGPPPLPPAMPAAIHSPSDPLEGFEEFIALAESGKRASSPPLITAPPVTQQAPPNSPPIQFRYQMVQIPPTVVVAQTKGNEAADYLQGVVNRYSDNGWEFYRVDQIGVQVAPGCLTVLLGQRAETVHYYVITFRRPKEE